MKFLTERLAEMSVGLTTTPPQVVVGKRGLPGKPGPPGPPGIENFMCLENNFHNILVIYITLFLTNLLLDIYSRGLKTGRSSS